MLEFISITIGGSVILLSKSMITYVSRMPANGEKQTLKKLEKQIKKHHTFFNNVNKTHNIIL